MGELLETLLARTGVIETLEAERTIEATGRIENLQELVGVAREYVARSEEPSLAGFLQEVALTADADALAAESGTGRVTLMTLHNAKGLEFDAVFVIGMEQNLFPHVRAIEEANIEEERRLCYVAITRARRELCPGLRPPAHALRRARQQPPVAVHRRDPAEAGRARAQGPLDVRLAARQLDLAVARGGWGPSSAGATTQLPGIAPRDDVPTALGRRQRHPRPARRGRRHRHGRRRPGDRALPLGRLGAPAAPGLRAAQAHLTPRTPLVSSAPAGRLAQLGEHQLDKLGVTGSSPVSPIPQSARTGGGVLDSKIQSPKQKKTFSIITPFAATGVRVSKPSLGTMSMGSSAWKGWVLDEDDSIPILRRALDLGITFFDMADWYSTGRNEEVVGRNLLRMSARERLVLATKVYYPMSDDPNDRGLSRKHIATAIDRSLARMGTDYVDLYVIHAFDADTPVEETMEALHDTVRAGKVRYLGASTMYTWQFATMNHVAAMNGWTPFINMQCQYNLLYREEEREMFPYCRDQGIAITTFSPSRAASSRVTPIVPRAPPTTSIRISTAMTSTAKSHAVCASLPHAEA